MKKASSLIGTPPGLRLERAARPSGRCDASRDAHRADLELGDLRDRVDARGSCSWLAARSSGQWYGTKTVSGRMVFTTSARTTSAPRRLSTRTKSPSAMPSSLGEPRVDLAVRLGRLVHQRADAPRLRAGEVVRDHPAGGEDDRVLVVRLLRRRAPLDRLEVRLAVGVAEPAALVQPRRARVVFGRDTARRRPLRVDLLPGDAGVVGDAALRGHAQLVEDLSRRAVGELVARAQAAPPGRR